MNLKQLIKKQIKKPDLESKIIKTIKQQKRIHPDYYKSRNTVLKLKNHYKLIKEPILDISKINNCYDIYVNDESIVNPFVISPSLVKIIKNHTRNAQTKESKAKSVYNWMHENIKYGKNNRQKGYRNSKEVLVTKEGVCGEMTFLYIAMTRCIGLRSAYVSVRRDMDGRDVCHACAVVDVGKDVYVDVAYNRYDIYHLKQRILCDAEVIRRFNSWRENA